MLIWVKIFTYDFPYTVSQEQFCLEIYLECCWANTTEGSERGRGCSLKIMVTSTVDTGPCFLSPAFLTRSSCAPQAGSIKDALVMILPLPIKPREGWVCPWRLITPLHSNNARWRHTWEIDSFYRGSSKEVETISVIYNACKSCNLSSALPWYMET